MKNVFLTNKLVKTLIIVLVLMVIAYFALPNYSLAAEVSIGGVLLEPIRDLLLLIGDSVMLLINKVLYNVDNSLIEIDNHQGLALRILTAALGVVVGVVLIWTGVGSVAGAITLGAAIAAFGAIYMPESFYLPYFTVSPQEIFANQVYFLDVNFFNPNEYEKQYTTDEGETKKSTAEVLKDTVSSWYYTILIISAAGLMCVLLYIAFKIIITSNTEEKAKYKERGKDWLIGMCLLATMHYIMVFSVTIVEAITKKLAEQTLDVVILPIPKEGITPDNQELIYNVIGTKGSLGLKEGINADGGDVINYPTTLLGQARLEAQLGEVRNKYEDTDAQGLAADSGQKVVDQNKAALHNFTYTLVYIILVFYTVSFLVVYIKRVMYMALLTILAPLVAMYYPIDKITDGQAQGFNTWLKEYVFNLLMQPFHLIIYIMLVGSAMNLAVDNPIYAIVAIGFILPAERLIRALFQLKKAANTTGESGSAIATMMGIHMLQPFKGMLGEKSSSKGDGADPSKVKTVDNGNVQGSLQSGNSTTGISGGNAGGKSSSPSGSAIQKGKLGKIALGKVAKGAKTVGKTAGRIAVTGVGTATGMALGAAAGIAAGKPADAIKYGTLLGSVGTKAGSGAIKGVKNLANGTEKTFTGMKNEYLQNKYGATDKEDIKFVKDYEQDFNNRYGNDARKWMQEGLALRREGLTDVNDIHQAIGLQKDGIEYYETSLINEEVNKKDAATGAILIGQKETKQKQVKDKKKVKLNRQDSIEQIRNAKEYKNVNLSNAEAEKKLYDQMSQVYKSKGFDNGKMIDDNGESIDLASRDIAIIKHIQGNNT